MSKKILILSLLLVFAFQGTFLAAEGKESGEKTVSKKALKLMKKAQKAAQAGEIEKALEDYKKIMEMEPQYAPPYMGTAQIFIREKKFNDAISNLKKALELQPDFPAATELLAKIYFGFGQQFNKKQDFAKANEFYEKVLEVPGLEKTQKGLMSDTTYQMGLNYYNLRNFEKSNEYLLQFTKIPGVETDSERLFKTSIYLIGINFSQAKEKNIEESNDYLLKYLELDKDSPGNQLLPIANFMVGSNNFILLEKEVNKIKSDKEADKKKRIAKLARERKDIQPFLSKAIELKSDLEPAYMTLGNYYYYCDELENTEKIYATLVEKFPNSPDVAMYKSFLEDIKKELEKKKK